MKAVALWSGGKDSCLACYEALSKGFEIISLLNFIYRDNCGENLHRPADILSHIYRYLNKRTPKIVSDLLSFAYKDFSRMISHEITAETVIMQAHAMEIPIIQKEVTWSTFESELKSTIWKLKGTGVEGVILGLVSPHYPLNSSEKLREYRTLTAHRDWFYRVCSELSVKPIAPLWGKSPDQNLAEFIEKNFEAIIVVLDPSILNKEWLGRKVDREFLDEMRRLNREKGIHIGGSAYHTFVTGGPLFKKRLQVYQGKKLYKNGYFVLDIPKVELLP